MEVLEGKVEEKILEEGSTLGALLVFLPLVKRCGGDLHLKGVTRHQATFTMRGRAHKVNDTPQGK